MTGYVGFTLGSYQYQSPKALGLFIYRTLAVFFIAPVNSLYKNSFIIN